MEQNQEANEQLSLDLYKLSNLIEIIGSLDIYFKIYRITTYFIDYPNINTITKEPLFKQIELKITIIKCSALTILLSRTPNR